MFRLRGRCPVAREKHWGERTNTAVVRSLRAGETACGPCKWAVIETEEGVFLLETEPRVLLLGLVHDLLRMVTEVGPVRGAREKNKTSDALVYARGCDEVTSGAAERASRRCRLTTRTSPAIKCTLTRRCCTCWQGRGCCHHRGTDP